MVISGHFQNFNTENLISTPQPRSHIVTVPQHVSEIQFLCLLHYNWLFNINITFMFFKLRLELFLLSKSGMSAHWIWADGDIMEVLLRARLGFPLCCVETGSIVSYLRSAIFLSISQLSIYIFSLLPCIYKPIVRYRRERTYSQTIDKRSTLDSHLRERV